MNDRPALIVAWVEAKRQVESAKAVLIEAQRRKLEVEDRLTAARVFLRPEEIAELMK